MSNTDIEIRLLEDYLDAAMEAETQSDAARTRVLYEKQLARCKSQGIDFEVERYEATVYFVRAYQKLKLALEKASSISARYPRSSTGFEGVAPAVIANRGVKETSREIIPLLDQAISIYDNDADWWLLRAHMHITLNDKKAALRDVDHVLANFGDNDEVYLDARKLKDEVEAMKDKSDGCFIATAVYETPDSSELLILRDYRDQVLLGSSIGKAVVATYYSVSPSIARLLRRSRRARQAVRFVLLDPFVAVLSRRNNHA